MENQIKAAFFFPPRLRVQTLLALAHLEQKEIAITHGKSDALISAVIRHNYPSIPTKQAIFNSLVARLPMLLDVCPDFKALFSSDPTTKRYPRRKAKASAKNGGNSVPKKRATKTINKP